MMAYELENIEILNVIDVFYGIYLKVMQLIG